MQVALVYRQPFRCNLLLKCVSQPKIELINGVHHDGDL